MPGLVSCMRKQPKLFSHLKQKTHKGKSVEDWVVVAKELSKNNGGILPSNTSIIKNKMSGLVVRITKNPEFFKGMRQKYKCRSGIRIIGEE